MGVAAGPNIIKDGLLFGYDTGYGLKYFDDNRYYKGKPSTNYIAHQNAVPQSSYSTYVHTTGTWADNHPLAIRAYNAQGNEITGYVNTGVNSGNYTPWQHAHWRYDYILNKPVVVSIATDSQWKAKSFGASMGAWADLGMAAGDKYIISWLQYTTDLNLCADAGFYSKNTSNSNGFHDGRSGSSAKNTKLNTWQRVHHVYTVSSNRNLSNSYGSVYMYTHTTSNNDGEVRIADVQLEIDTEYPSAYIAQPTDATIGSRANTESVIDLTESTSINVSNVSFDSTGQPTFDGTDDHISLSSASWNILTTHTLEAVFKANGSPGNGYHVMFQKEGGYSGGAVYGLRANPGGTLFAMICYDNQSTSQNTLGGGTLVNNQWYHVIATFDSLYRWKFYINGALVNSTTLTGNPYQNSSSITIGRGDGRHTNGDLPVMKIYNRALSALEVEQNYNSYKNRFNL